MYDLAFAILAATFLVYHILEARTWSHERAKLLDRIMARNYGEFVYTRTVSEAETPQMITDEAEAAYAKEVQTLDRAWHERNAKEHPELYPDGIEAVA